LENFYRGGAFRKEKGLGRRGGRGRKRD